METYGRKRNIAKDFFNLFKKRTGYILVGINSKAYNKEVPYYRRVV